MGSPDKIERGIKLCVFFLSRKKSITQKIRRRIKKVTTVGFPADTQYSSSCGALKII